MSVQIAKRKFVEDSNINDSTFDKFETNDRIKSKSKKFREDKHIEICYDCGYGKYENKCRCSVNYNLLKIEENKDIKLCIFCDSIVNACICTVTLWSIAPCNTCKIYHSIFNKCGITNNCIHCDKLNNATQMGCRCMNNHINFINTDINMKMFTNMSDYVLTVDTPQYQLCCTECDKHVMNCTCINYYIVQNDNDNWNLYDGECDDYDYDYDCECEDYNYKKDMTEQMDCD